MKSCLALVGLLAPIVFAALVAVEKAGQSLLLFPDKEPPVRYTQEEGLVLQANYVEFIDGTTPSGPGHTEHLTHVPAAQSSALPVLATFPPISRQATVNALIANLSTTNLESYLSTLTSFFNRFYHSESGEAAAEALYNTVSDIALDAERSDVTVTQVYHHYPSNLFYQKSVIARIEGADPSAPIVILGSHLDSTGGGDGLGRGPGADDDGSGVVTLLESYRALLQNDFRPSVPVEFHWYAGEEGDLLGSKDIAKKYAVAGVPVRAMVHFDMTAYTQPGKTPAVTFITDYVDAPLTAYLASLVDEYLSIGSARTQCGNPCSDHASWHLAGYPAAYPFEAENGFQNRYGHTPNDTVDAPGFSFAQILEFTKLAVAVLVELGS